MQGSVIARINLATALVEQDKDDEAEVHYSAALAVCPLGTRSMGSLGERLALRLNSGFGSRLNKRRSVVLRGGRCHGGGGWVWVEADARRVLVVTALSEEAYWVDCKYLSSNVII